MTEKALEAYNDVFVDIVNNLVFGRERILESELEQAGRGLYTRARNI